MGTSAYRAVWLIAMFDLPTETKAHKRAYTRFRKALLKDGFMQLQYSVYARYCGSEDSSVVHRKRIRIDMPIEGEVRVLAITDRQFGKMEVFRGKKKEKPETGPVQLELF